MSASASPIFLSMPNMEPMAMSEYITVKSCGGMIPFRILDFLFCFNSFVLVDYFCTCALTVLGEMFPYPTMVMMETVKRMALGVLHCWSHPSIVPSYFVSALAFSTYSTKSFRSIWVRFSYLQKRESSWGYL